MAATEAAKNFFELFGLPAAFDLDTAELASRYRELQRRLHPDKFAGAAAAERRLSLQITATVNEAYQTLRDPVRRARYLLALDGVRTDEESDTRMDPGFLMEQMELREALTEVRDLPEPHKRLAELANEAGRRLAHKIDEFRNAFGEGLAGRERARSAIREMQFLDKLRREIDELEEELS